jgi:sugar phosphate isomerase/epimerase
VKLAVSNIAWDRAEEGQVFALLRAYLVSGIEVAPTVYWPDWSGVNARGLEEVRSTLAEEGFRVPALQSLLFGKPELRLFNRERRQDLITHMTLVADMAAGLGAGSAVFGSPKNRKRGPLGWGEAWSYARDLFGALGVIFSERGVILGVELNPIEYGCDFLTNARDAADFVRAVGSPGIGLHLDTGALALAGGDIRAIIETGIRPCHFHASQPNLESFASPNGVHAVAGQALASTGYDGWISIEMRKGADALGDIAQAVRFVKGCYRLPGEVVA